MDRFVFEQEQHRRWMWMRVDAAGEIVGVSLDSFPYYLKCVVDAMQHGFDGKPFFVGADGEICSPIR